MKKLIILIIINIVLFSCKSKQKVQTIQTAIATKDTTKPVVIKQAELPKKIDSSKIIREIFDRVANKKINFNTFNAKVKVEYIGKDESQNVTAYISILKGKEIYIKLKASFLGVLVMEAKITRDSVYLINLFKENYMQKRTINYLNDITQIPFDYQTLEDLIVGNPVFVQNNEVVSYRFTNNNQLTILSLNKMFKHLLSLDKNDYTLTHSKLDDVDTHRNRTCDITYGGYQLINKFNFPLTRSISVAEKSKLDFNLEFKDVSFNEAMKYSFELPKKIKLK